MDDRRPPPQRIYHLALRDEWQPAVDRGEPYRRSTLGRSLDDEGFIHCSFAHQVAATALRFYRDRDDVVLLEIDATRLRAPLRVEQVPDADDAFPHLYGPLDIDAVVGARPVPVGADGTPDVVALLEPRAQQA